jgi:ABC-type transport system involved in multi-copper enzyme maturation permease subunit
LDKKSKGMIFTIVTAVLFGLPGLLTLAFSLFAFMTPDSMEATDSVAAAVKIISLILGVILVSIPIFVGYYMLRPEPSAPAEAASSTPPPNLENK